MRYRLAFEADDNGTILVTSPDFPQMVTYGEDEASAVRNAADAIDVLIDSMMRAREEIPEPTSLTSAHAVELSLQDMMKLELHKLMIGSKLTRADLTRRLEWKRESVDRLFRLHHASRVDQYEKAFNILGKDVGLVVKPREEMVAS